jgi:hypothetical protein
MAMTRKEFWIQAYIACLSEHGTNTALTIADAALKACEERWKTPVVEGVIRLYGEMPVGEPDFNRTNVPYRESPAIKD